MTCKHCTHFLPIVIFPFHLSMWFELNRNNFAEGSISTRHKILQVCVVPSINYLWSRMHANPRLMCLCPPFPPASPHVAKIMCWQTRLSFCFAACCYELRMSAFITSVCSGGSVAASATPGCVWCMCFHWRFAWIYCACCELDMHMRCQSEGCYILTTQRCSG